MEDPARLPRPLAARLRRRLAPTFAGLLACGCASAPADDDDIGGDDDDIGGDDDDAGPESGQIWASGTGGEVPALDAAWALSAPQEDMGEDGYPAIAWVLGAPGLDCAGVVAYVEAWFAATRAYITDEDPVAQSVAEFEAFLALAPSPSWYLRLHWFATDPPAPGPVAMPSGSLSLFFMEVLETGDPQNPTNFLADPAFLFTGADGVEGALLATTPELAGAVEQDGFWRDTEAGSQEPITLEVEFSAPRCDLPEVLGLGG